MEFSVVILFVIPLHFLVQIYSVPICLVFLLNFKQKSPGGHNFPSCCQWQCFLGACGKEDFLIPFFPPVSLGAELPMGLEQPPVVAAGHGRRLLWGGGTADTGVQGCRTRPCSSLLEGCAETDGAQVWP